MRRRGSSFFLLRPLELGFGLGVLLRMAGHDCTYSASNRDSARHVRLTQAGRQVRFRFTFYSNRFSLYSAHLG
jgi:hypothetical protein